MGSSSRPSQEVLRRVFSGLSWEVLHGRVLTGVLEVLRVLRGLLLKGPRLVSSEPSWGGCRRTLFQAFLEDSPEGPQSLSGEFLEFPGVFLGALLGRSCGGVLGASLDGSLGILRGILGGSLRPSQRVLERGGPPVSLGVFWVFSGGSLGILGGSSGRGLRAFPRHSPRAEGGGGPS